VLYGQSKAAVTQVLQHRQGECSKAILAEQAVPCFRACGKHAHFCLYATSV
jgi:hypothetical protein